MPVIAFIPRPRAAPERPPPRRCSPPNSPGAAPPSSSSTPIPTATSSIGRACPASRRRSQVIGDVSEETIVDAIEAAAAKAAFVIVDLEGTASLMVSYAISMADFVVIPVQGSQLDAKQAARQMKLIRAQERIAQREIPFAVLFTRSNPALQPKTQRHIEQRFARDRRRRCSPAGSTTARRFAHCSRSAARSRRSPIRASAISPPPRRTRFEFAAEWFSACAMPRPSKEVA